VAEGRHKLRISTDMSADNERNLIISVAAGKGGTGKTLIATSLAVALNEVRPDNVQVIDCDVEEPNADILLHPQITQREPVHILVPEVDAEKCTNCGECAHACEFAAIAAIGKAVVTFHDLCAGCGVCSYVCPTGAIQEVELRIGELASGHTESGIDFHEGRLDVGHQRAGPVTTAVKEKIRDGLIVIVDVPPGTACPMQEAVDDTDYCILVTEPTPFGLSNLEDAVETCRRLAVPCGVVINRDRGQYEPTDKYVADEGLDLLLRVPEEREIAEAYSRGETLADAFPDWRDELVEMYEQISQQAAMQPSSVSQE